MAGSCLGLRVPWLCRGWIWDGRSPPDVPGQGCAPGSCCLDLLSQINHRVTVPLGDLCSPSTWNPSSASHLTVMVPGGWAVPLGHGTSSRASLGDCSLHHAQTHSAHSCSQGRSGAAGWNTASPPPPRLGCCTHHHTVPQFPLLTHTLCKTSSVSHLSGEDPLQSTLSGTYYYYYFSPKKIKYFLFISTFGCKVF